ncbi:MAG TPA: DUF1801 domain-containing protein [Chloroflexia bacterium]|nr:DUF1801 domain-containing protein [Chloroflexia bacterium]
MTPEELLSLHNPTVRPIVAAARELVLSAWPDAVERIIGTDKMFRYGTGPRMSDEVIYIAGFTSHANLGFVRGAVLPDPHGLLEGTGKGMRHVKLRSPEDVNRPGMRELVEAAVDLATR